VFGQIALGQTYIMNHKWWFIVGTSKIVGQAMKKIYLKTSLNSLHNDVAVLVR